MASRKTPGEDKKPGKGQVKQKPFEITPKGAEEATGSTSESVQLELIMKAASTLWAPTALGKEDRQRAMQAVYDTLRSIAPRSELEGMLAAQMVGAHNAAVECMRRAMIPDQTYEGRDQNLKHATKLMGIYERQLAALDKHRGKGQQKITVEHVTVQAGGQAIVGEVHTGGKEQAPRGGGQSALTDDSAAEALSREALKDAKPAKARSRKAGP